MSLSPRSITCRALTAFGLIAVASLWAGLPVAAQDYPTRPLRMVIPFGPDTGIDAIGRVFAKKLGAELGQPVVVDNKAGATGIIGAELVAKAPADGYTLLFSAGSVYALNPLLFAKLPYDPFKGFTSISMVYSQPLAIAISLKVPAKTIPELVSLARAKPESISAGTVGAFHVLSTQYFSNFTKTKLLNVNYKSGTLVALLSGEIDLVVDVISLLAPQHKAGKIRILAVASNKRMAIAPDVPTLAEVGYPGVEISTWTSLTGPANLPRPIVDKLNAAVARIVKSPEMTELAAAQGLSVFSSTPEAVDELVRSEYARWQKVAVDAGIKPQ
ncbi:Bug family tripartite tricarboxylate transporter substrate binding protein [Variovorax sp. PBL-E5]|uniref:Bug family tripartite tricarboxylate transporter substrate binding protein n=1 Tax=Variovorax sp. PBL-E5 TaxID=434014 RepID=UPI0013191B96|nr:tripartite tricarboxylate transporter substrate-binding protein [Variovorax sp. PBL-E5]VTU45082.1 Argininosuccinate lyase [Variovorax sp. PBL-E5]